MNRREWLAEQFEENRAHLRRVAYRMLGTSSEADDAVQEAWLRLNRTDTSGVENLGGWLTTVVGRVCLDMLRSRKSRREEPLESGAPEPTLLRDDETHPEHEAQLADSIGLALLTILETLDPAERVAFVLHDMFAVPFDEIAPIVGRSTAAARQLASRARRRVQGTNTIRSADRTRKGEVVEAFLAASRGGDFGALLALLDPGVVLKADQMAVDMAAANVSRGAPALLPEVAGAKAVADIFSGRAQAVQPALVNGEAGLVWATGGKPRVAFRFAVSGERIVEINMIADPRRVQELDIEILDH